MSTTKQATQDDKQQAAPTTPTKPKDDYPHLSNPNAAIYVRAVMERAKEDFAACLKKLPGKKMLVLDEDLIGPLGLVADTQYIRENDVEKITRLTTKPFDTPTKNIVYIVRPKIHLMKWIATQIKHFQTAKNTPKPQPPVADKSKKKDDKTPPTPQEPEDSSDKKFAVFFVPRLTLICKRVLHELGVEGDLIVGEYPLDLIPFDYDIMSMEIPGAFKECHLDGDFSSLYYVARSVMKLQSFFGLIPNVKAKGKLAKNVLEMIIRMRRQVGNEILTSSPEIDTLILIDREVDMVTPMFTQFTYEGLIDELFGIKNSLFQPNFPCSVDTKPGTKTKILLRSTDNIFIAIRDLPNNYLGPTLKEKALEIDREIQKKADLQTVKQLKEFAMKLPMLQEDKKNLEMHITIAQEISAICNQPDFKRLFETQHSMLMGENEQQCFDFIEENINKQEPLTKVLRLLCLMSLTSNGIKPKLFDFFKKEILQTYGLECLLTLNNLERIGLLKRQESSKPFPQIRKKFDLFSEDTKLKDVHSVYSGYAPLSVQLIEKASDPKGFKGVDGVDLLSPPTLEYVQKGAVAGQQDKKVILLYFIGGITFAELSAIRYLNEKYSKSDDGRVYLVATTKLINGSTFLESLFDNVGNMGKNSGEALFKKKTPPAPTQAATPQQGTGAPATQ